MINKQRFNRLLSRRSALAGGVSAIAAVGALTIPTMCRGRVYPGIQYGAANLGGKSPYDAETRLRRELSDFENRALTVKFEDQEWHASLAEIGFSVNYQAMMAVAMDHGRTYGPLDRYQTYVQHDAAREVPLMLHEDTESLRGFIRGIANETDISPTDARLERVDGDVVIIPEIEGRATDVELAFTSALQVLRDGRQADVTLEANPVAADVTQEHLAGAKEDAWKLIHQGIVFIHGDNEYPVSREALTQALQIDDHNQASIDPTALGERFNQISNATRVAPTNVMLGWDGGPFVIAEDVDGAEVDIDKIQDLVVELASGNERSASLPMRSVKADARADNISELGLESHLAYGSSSFYGSSAARAENVRVSAQNISYKLVAPGETFSYNDLQGPISEDHGYVAGTIISDNWVESAIGGGVCQVSTTVFRAAAKAGFRFSEWHPHSWRLAFYEADGSDPGLDAAIYQAESDWEWTLDLTFENTLDSWLLLVVTTEGDWVTAHLYGKDAGWNVEMFPAQVSDPIPPGPAEERVNPNLPRGERRMVQTSQPGYVVRVRRLITASSGEVLADGEFVSDYVPQPEAWEIGPS